jgi:hypothetical protein
MGGSALQVLSEIRTASFYFFMDFSGNSLALLGDGCGTQLDATYILRLRQRIRPLTAAPPVCALGGSRRLWLRARYLCPRWASRTAWPGTGSGDNHRLRFEFTRTAMV